MLPSGGVEAGTPLVLVAAALQQLGPLISISSKQRRIHREVAAAGERSQSPRRLMTDICIWRWKQLTKGASEEDVFLVVVTTQQGGC